MLIISFHRIPCYAHRGILYRKSEALHCYGDVDPLPEVPVLYVVAVPVGLTVDLTKQVRNGDSRAIIIITSGFGEAGNEDLETEIPPNMTRLLTC